MMQDSSAQKADGHPASAKTDFMTLTGGACGACLIFATSVVMKRVSNIQATFMITIGTNLLLAIGLLLTSAASLSMDAENGLFGWVRIE